MSPNGEPPAPILGSAVTSAASLPPMSTFRGSAAVAANSGTGAPSPASLQYSHSPGAPASGAPSTAPSAPTTNQPSAGDTLGKALASVVSTPRVSTTHASFIHLFVADILEDLFRNCLTNHFPPQIYPTDQSVSSYSSNPSTPVSSPPPLTGSGPGWAPGAAPVSPHFTADPNRGTIHMVCIYLSFSQSQIPSLNFLFLLIIFDFLSSNLISHINHVFYCLSKCQE